MNGERKIHFYPIFLGIIGITLLSLSALLLLNIVIPHSVNFYFNIKILYLVWVVLAGAFLSLSYKYIPHDFQIGKRFTIIRRCFMWGSVLSITILCIVEILFGNDRVFQSRITEREELFANLRTAFFLIALLTTLIFYYMSFVDRKEKEIIYVQFKKYTPFVLLIFIIFIISRISLPIFYHGSFYDEYFHIFSGIDFLEHGSFTEFYKGSLYERGSYVSVLTAIYFSLFGKSLFVAKLVPITIGIINFIILNRIATRVLRTPFYRNVLLVVYTLSSWVLLNDFFLRMYVFYEFFILLVTYFGLLLYSSIKRNSIPKIIFVLLIATIVMGVSVIGSNDPGGQLIGLYGAILYWGIYYYFGHELQYEGTNRIFKLFHQLCHLKISYKRILTVILVVGIIGGLIYTDKLGYILNADLVITGKSNYKYGNLFVNLNFVFTIFYAMGIVLFCIKSKYVLKPFIIATSVLLYLHIISSPSLQLIRSITYLLPLFYLIAIDAYSKLSAHKLYKTFILVIIAITIYINIPKNFFVAPNYPSEVDNFEYQELYSFVHDACKDSILFNFISYPFKSEFYQVKTDYTSLIRYPYLLEDKSYYYDEEDNVYRTTVKDIPIFTDPQKILSTLQAHQSKPHCIILHSEFYWRFVDNQTLNYIESNYPVRYTVSTYNIYIK